VFVVERGSGYWYVRFEAAHRFGQWRIGEQPSADDFFPNGHWSEQEIAEALAAVAAHMSAILPLEQRRLSMTDEERS